MEEKVLKAKKVGELKEIARTFGVDGYDKMKKAELIEALSQIKESEQKPSAEPEKKTQPEKKSPKTPSDSKTSEKKESKEKDAGKKR